MRRISLNQTPLFYEFLKKFIKFIEYDKIFDFDIQNELYITGYCKCGQNDCATVYLKRINNWDKIYHSIDIISTSKGFFFIHIEDDGFMEFEALKYCEYPYQDEIIQVFKGDISNPTKNEFDKIDKYFLDLELVNMNS
jgi:hypothetical protein